ncbi:lipid transport family protein [Pelomyxa schiedti]|nr:lipid transport family protein [Pelomyxa schiedti]
MTSDHFGFSHRHRHRRRNRGGLGGPGDQFCIRRGQNSCAVHEGRNLDWAHRADPHSAALSDVPPSGCRRRGAFGSGPGQRVRIHEQRTRTLAVIWTLMAVVLGGCTGVCVATRTASAQSLTAGLQYTIGDVYTYSITGCVSVSGVVPAAKAYHIDPVSLEGVADITCLREDADSYLFSLLVTNEQIGEGADCSTGKENPHLVHQGAQVGYPLYFLQNSSGEIPKVWVNPKDTQYDLNIKLAVVNALQTRIFPQDHREHVTLEEDCAGAHYTTFKTTRVNKQNAVYKSYSEDDFQRFRDPTLSPDSVRIRANGIVTFSSPGNVIYSASLAETATLLAKGLNSSQSEANSDRTEPLSEMNGIDSPPHMNLEMSATGKVDLRLISFTPTPTMQLHPHEIHLNLGEYTESSLGLHIVPMRTQPTSDRNALNELMEEKRFSLKTAQRAALHLRNFPESVRDWEGYFKIASSIPEMQSRLFAVAALANCESLLVRYGLESSVDSCKLQATLAAVNLASPSAHLLYALSRNAKIDDKSQNACDNGMCADEGYLQCVSLLTYSKLVSTIDDGNLKHRVLQQLVSFLWRSTKEYAAYQKKTRSSHASECLLYALANFDSALVDSRDLPWQTLLRSKYPSVLRAFTFFEDSRKSSSYRVTRQSNPQFKHNYTYEKSVKLGGAAVSSVFGVTLSAGTNFDCSTANFDYSVFADVLSSTTLFGNTKGVFEAQAIYSKIDSMEQGNSMLVKIWGCTIFHHSFSVLDCLKHDTVISSISPGVATSYTIWVSFLPVTFTLSTSLNLNLNLGWQICDSNLSASIQVVPKAEMIFSGSAEVDLLLLQAGISLDGSFSTQLVPSVDLEGSLCSLDAQIRHQGIPAQAELAAYRRWKHCRLFHRDSCRWGPIKTKILWSWEHPSVDDVLVSGKWYLGGT